MPGTVSSFLCLLLFFFSSSFVSDTRGQSRDCRWCDDRDTERERERERERESNAETKLARDRQRVRGRGRRGGEAKRADKDRQNKIQSDREIDRKREVSTWRKTQRKVPTDRQTDI